MELVEWVCLSTLLLNSSIHFIFKTSLVILGEPFDECIFILAHLLFEDLCEIEGVETILSSSTTNQPLSILTDKMDQCCVLIKV